MKWKFNADRPVYQQIMEQIQGAVLTGEFTPGQKIPSVRDLATDAQVNPNTMQHALQELEGRQLLVTEGTSGRRVTDDPGILENIRRQRLQELTAECVAKFAVLGVSPEEASYLLANYHQEREEL